MKRLYWLLPLAGIFFIASCYTLDSASGVEVTPQAPDTLIVANHARVSTLNGFDCTIYRDDEAVRRVHVVCDIAAGGRTAIKLDGVPLQDGDTAAVTSADLSWSM